MHQFLMKIFLLSRVIFWNFEIFKVLWQLQLKLVIQPCAHHFSFLSEFFKFFLRNENWMKLILFIFITHVWIDQGTTLKTCTEHQMNTHLQNGPVSFLYTKLNLILNPICSKFIQGFKKIFQKSNLNCLQKKALKKRK